MSKNTNNYVKLAKETVEEYVLKGKRKKEPVKLEEGMENRAGVFVSIKKNGKLRGCIGTIKPTQKNIAQEIISNAISAAAHDPRFMPVNPEELNDLDYSVDILTEPELVDSIEELDPEKYGVIVEKDHRKGLLLPDLEGVDTPEKQVEIAKRKAGISGDDNDIKLYRFKVIRYK